jgi:glucose/arabinose dehydrogenase
LLGIVVLAALTLTSCGDDDNDNPARPAESPPTSPAPATSTRPRPPATTSTTTVSGPDLANVRVRLAPVAQGLDSPVALAWRRGDERMYVAEQSGIVRAVDANGTVSREAVLSIGVSRGNEQGLLGIAFSPDGTKLYVHYTDPAGNSHVDEYTMDGDVADPSSRREVLFQSQPFPNHNGGQVSFGPDDMLYIGFGDGGAAGDPQNNAPNLNTLLGKILRIDPNASGGNSYAVPSDNPFVGQSGARTEIWMYGLRNPWRFSFDRENGDVWIGDVGQGAYEEIDYAPAGDAGIDWGWNAQEGFETYKGPPREGARDPLLAPSQDDGNCAIIGGYVYRGAAIPALNGVYVFGDSCRSPLVGVVREGNEVADQRDLGVEVESLTTFGEHSDGELYAVAREGTVYRLTAG